MSALFVITSVLFLLLSVYLYRTFTYWQRRGVECVASPASVAMLRRFCDILLSGRTDLDAINRLYRRMGDRRFGGVYMFTRPLLILKDPDLIRRIYTKDFQHFVDRGFCSNPASDPIAKNLIHLNGREWKTVKQSLGTMFTLNKVQELAMATILQRSDDVLTVMGEHERDGRTVEVVDLCRRFGIDCFVGPFLGMDEVNTVLNEDSELVEVGKQCVRSHYIRHVFFGSLYPELHRLLRIPVTTKPVREFFQLLVKKLVVARRESRQLERNNFLQTLIDMKD